MGCRRAPGGYYGMPRGTGGLLWDAAGHGGAIMGCRRAPGGYYGMWRGTGGLLWDAAGRVPLSGTMEEVVVLTRIVPGGPGNGQPHKPKRGLKGEAKALGVSGGPYGAPWGSMGSSWAPCGTLWGLRGSLWLPMCLCVSL